MGAQITFDPAAWKARYPEFTAVSDAQAQRYFDEATLYCRNDGGGPVPNAATLTTLLNMLTAHIAAIYSLPSGGPKPANAPPGQVINASEGSVSVQFQNNYAPGTAQWYQQTKYGSSYWAATSIYRRFRYIPPGGCAAGMAGLYSPGWNYPQLNQ